MPRSVSQLTPTAKVATLTAGDPRKGVAPLGSLVSQEAVNRIRALVEDAGSLPWMGTMPVPDDEPIRSRAAMTVLAYALVGAFVMSVLVGIALTIATSYAPMARKDQDWNGALAPAELAAWILADRLPVRLGLQLHKLLWNDEPGR